MPIRPDKPTTAPETHTNLPPVRSRSRPSTNAEGRTATSERTDPSRPEDKADYAVGYGKPPIASRFKPGQSGNSKGRPKSARSLNTIVRDTLTQKVVVRTPSGDKRISRIEAALHKAVELAMKGNPRVLAQLIKLYAEAVPEAKSTADEQVPTATDLAIIEELLAMLTASQEHCE